VRPHAEMQRLIAEAAAAIHPALSPTLIGGAGLVDDQALRFATMTIEQQLRSPRGPTTAVYITWDTHGRCRYVGSVRRPHSRAAVRARLAEHLRAVERRGTWYAATVLPVRADLSLEVVRQCEGIIARRLAPVDGSAHPVPSALRSLSDLVAPQLVGRTSSKS
jgi:hypothetical protein